ncbi:MAG: histidine phosphatase family protein [Theionarchaea archaeon]|nr:histidine phosphatase family protein [Theionarchaea archaeon]
MHVLMIRHGRHGEPAIPSEGNLTLEGIGQAETTGRVLTDLNIERLFSSPYPRAMQTASIISRGIGINVEIIADIRNKERSRESILPRSGISRRHPDFILPEDLPENWLSGEESWADLYARARRASSLIKSMESAHERVALVTHAVTLDALTSLLIGLGFNERMRFWYDNCSLTLLSIIDGRGRLHYLNDVSHLHSDRELFFP